MNNQFQWFPGHMSKAIKHFEQNAKQINCFIVLLDSRAPYSSFINLFPKIYKQKKVLVIFTKKDMVEKKELKQWENHYNKTFPTISCDLRDKKISKRIILDFLNKNMGNQNLINKLAILGIPNVGKSTLINVLKEKNSSLTRNIPGLTKNSLWYQFAKKYLILDTPGILEPKYEEQEKAFNMVLINGIKTFKIPLNKTIDHLFSIIYPLKNEEQISSIIQTKINNQKNEENELFRKIIFDFNNLKFGKIILDNSDILKDFKI